MEQQSLNDSTAVYNLVHWIFKVYCWELQFRKKISFKIWILTKNIPDHPRAPMEIYNRWMLLKRTTVKRTFILQTMGWVIKTSKSYYLRMFCNSIVALHTDSDGFRLNKLKWFTILEAFKNIIDSREEVKILILVEIWKMLVITLKDNFERFKTSVKEVLQTW